MNAELHPGRLRLILESREITQFMCAHQEGMPAVVNHPLQIYNLHGKKILEGILDIHTREDINRSIHVMKKHAQTARYEVNIAFASLPTLLERGVISDYQSGDECFGTIYRADFLDILK